MKLSEGVTVSGVCRTKVRDARECLSVLRIKLRKKYKKEKVTRRKHSFSNSGEKNPITGMKIFVTFLLGYRKRQRLTTNTDKYSHYKLQIKR